MKKKWRNIINLSAAILYKEDLAELISIMSEGDNNELGEISIRLSVGETEITTNSFEELINEASGVESNKLVLTNTFSGGGYSILTLYFNYIELHISTSNETWYYGKIEQLKRFFLKRQPWYYKFPIVPAYVIISLLGVILTPVLAVSNMHTHLYLSVLSLIALCIFSYALISNVNSVFPYVKIYLSDKERFKMPYQLISVILASISIIVAIVLHFIKQSS